MRCEESCQDLTWQAAAAKFLDPSLLTPHSSRHLKGLHFPRASANNQYLWRFVAASTGLHAEVIRILNTAEPESTEGSAIS